MSSISLENRFAIYDLLARYSHYVDEYNSEGWSGLFLEDGKITGVPTPSIGRQAVYDRCEALKTDPRKMRHSTTNVYFEDGANDEKATVKAYGLVTNWAVKPPQPEIFAIYRYDLVNTAEGWKIAEMNVHTPYRD